MRGRRAGRAQRRHARGVPGGPARTHPHLPPRARLPAGRPPGVLVAPRARGAHRPDPPAPPAAPPRCTAPRARVARGSRIWVEGRHDAELVEKVWGDDLRVEGVVVEPLDGVDDLAAALRGFSPGPGRRRRRARRPPGRRDQGVPDRPECPGRHAGTRARARGGAPLRRHLAGGAPAAPGPRAPGRRSRAGPTGRQASGLARLGRTPTRPTSPTGGSGSSAPCARTQTSSRRSCPGRGADRLRHRRVGCAATPPGGPFRDDARHQAARPRTGPPEDA